MKINPETDRINFGKYKGMTYDQIYDTDTGYILWLHSNVKTIAFPDEFIDCAMMDDVDMDDPFYGWDQEF